MDTTTGSQHLRAYQPFFGVDLLKEVNVKAITDHLVEIADANELTDEQYHGYILLFMRMMDNLRKSGTTSTIVLDRAMKTFYEAFKSAKRDQSFVIGRVRSGNTQV